MLQYTVIIDILTATETKATAMQMKSWSTKMSMKYLAIGMPVTKLSDNQDWVQSSILCKRIRDHLFQTSLNW
jgi:hypothetical protein